MNIIHRVRVSAILLIITNEVAFTNADNYEDKCTLLNNINEEGKKKNMKLNAKKTKVMHIGKGNYNDISIDGETLEKVLEFIYLGSCKTVDGDCKVDINRRIARA